MQLWKKLSSKLAFENRWFTVRQDTVELPNGKVIDDYLMWEEGDVVFILPVTTDNNLILVKQYKHAAGEITIEFPAGYLNQGESPEDGARRELLEETGYDYSKLTKLFVTLNNPTKIIGTYHYFIAEEAYKRETNELKQDATENIEVLVKSFEEVYAMLLSNEIKATSSVAAGFMVLEKLHFLRR